jgi:signal-transduction protein with cAMP-binding, CBS, and nucleotidyltransferase domain
MEQPKLVRDLMTPHVATCTRDTLIPEVARQMRDLDISALVVVDEAGLMEGIISRTDLAALRAHDEYWHGLRAEHVMIKQIVCVMPTTSLVQAIEVMLTRKIHRVIVAEDCTVKSKPIGVLSLTDIVRDMAE